MEQLARLNRFEHPSKAILKIFDYRLARHTENNAFAVELGFYEYDGSRLKKKISNTAPDMLAIAACPKTWLHRMIERHDILRRIFKVVRLGSLVGCAILTTSAAKECELRSRHVRVL